MTGGTRVPSCKERENNKRRERRRRAIAAKIFAGLRQYGGYKLPKHCDNNEVLKALCNEAGWVVHPDGTTHRPGCKPVENISMVSGSVSASPCTSHNPSPMATSFPSSASSSHAPSISLDGNSLIPWLKNLSSSSSSSTSSKFLLHYMQGGSISAPVTPPLSSPTGRAPRMNANWDDSFARLGLGDQRYPFLPLSTPPSPDHRIFHDPKWLAGIHVSQSRPASPTFSLVSSNPFGFRVEHLTRGGSLVCTPGQSGTCSPAIPMASEHNPDVPMAEVRGNELAFGNKIAGLVKPWEGEIIHEECGSDDLELTLGGSRTR